MATRHPANEPGATALLLERAFAEHPGTLTEKAHLVGVSPRQLRRWRKEGWANVAVGTCDHILEVLGRGDPVARCLVAAGLEGYVGRGPHVFISGVLEEVLPSIVDAELRGVGLMSHHGRSAGKLISERVTVAIAKSDRDILDCLGSERNV
jgi:hypothetical protein